MRAFLTMVGKDLRQRSRDGTLIVFALVLPLGLAFLLNMLLGGDPEEDFSARYGVVDADGGELASMFVEDVLEPLEGEGILELRTFASEEEARESVEAGEIDAAFLVPDGFTDDLHNGDSVELRVLGDVDSPDEVQVADGVAEAFAAEYHRVELAVTTAEPSEEERAELALRAAEAPAAVRVVEDTDADWRQLDSPTYYAAGTAVFFLLFAAMPGVVSLFEERRTGTLVRLSASPVSTLGILAAKLASTVLVGLVSMVILITVSTFSFGAEWGDPLGVTVLTVAMVLAAVGIMSAVAGFATNAEQASSWATVVAMLLGLLGGALFPLANLGGLADLSYLTPHQWFLRGLSDLSTGDGLGSVLLPVGVLLAMALAGASVALYRMGRMLHP